MCRCLGHISRPIRPGFLGLEGRGRLERNFPRQLICRSATKLSIPSRSDQGEASNPIFTVTATCFLRVFSAGALRLKRGNTPHQELGRLSNSQRPLGSWQQQATPALNHLNHQIQCGAEPQTVPLNTVARFIPTCRSRAGPPLPMATFLQTNTTIGL
jgi:hypothetical protein